MWELLRKPTVLWSIAVFIWGNSIGWGLALIGWGDVYISLGIWLIAGGIILGIILAIYGYMRYGKEKQSSEHVGKRIGIRMKGGKGDFERIKIHKQDVSINTENTDLKAKDMDIE